MENEYYRVLDALIELFLKKIEEDSKFNRDEICNIKDISISTDEVRNEAELKDIDDKTLGELMCKAGKVLLIKGFLYESKDRDSYSIWLAERSRSNDKGDLILTPTQELLEVYNEIVFNTMNLKAFRDSEELEKEVARLCREQIIRAIDDIYWR